MQGGVELSIFLLLAFSKSVFWRCGWIGEMENDAILGGMGCQFCWLPIQLLLWLSTPFVVDTYKWKKGRETENRILF